MAENVRTGPAAFYSSFRPLGLIYSTRKETKQIKARAEEAMEHCNIAHLAEQDRG